MLRSLDRPCVVLICALLGWFCLVGSPLASVDGQTALLSDELVKFLQTSNTIAPDHTIPIGALKIALPQYCPVSYFALPNTLLINPCILELSRRLVTAIIDQQDGTPDNLAADSPLLTSMEQLLAQVPEATHYFTFRSKHLDPRTWSVALTHLRTTCDTIVAEANYYSVVNKTRFVLDPVRYPGRPTDPHYLYSRTSVPAPEMVRVTGGLAHGTYGVYPAVQSDDYDVQILNSMSQDLRQLALGWFLLKNDTYAHRAVHQVNTWFVNPVSAMMPSADYAGIADTQDPDPLKDVLVKFNPLIEILDSIALLQDSEYYSWDIARGLLRWFTAYLDHILTSTVGAATARRSDYRANFYLAQIISIAAFTGDRLSLIREAIELAAANQEVEIGKNGVILGSVLLEDETERWNYITNTMQAHIIIGLQAQFATDLRRMVRPDGYKPTNGIIDDAAPKGTTPAPPAPPTEDLASSGLSTPGSSKRSRSLPSDTDPWIAAASASAAAASALVAAAAMMPDEDRWVFLPDMMIYLQDSTYLFHTESLATVIEGLDHTEQVTIRGWMETVNLDALAANDPSLPPMAAKFGSVLWQFASIWESPWYQWRSARGASRCLTDVNYALPYQCYSLTADRLSPLVRSMPDGWVFFGAFAPVRVLPGDTWQQTNAAGLFPGVAIFDTASLPFFLSLGIFGLLRWSSFIFRIVPAIIWLCRERRRPRYFKSLRYRAEKDVTIICPTIDSGSELKIAILSWLKNRPKRLIFSTIHKERAAITKLLQTCVEEFEVLLVKEREQLMKERKNFDLELCDDLVDDGFRTAVDVISVGHPNKRQQMVAAFTHLDTELVVMADDDAIWPVTLLERTLACFDNPEIGGVVTEQRMRPVPRDQKNASWLRVGDATVWEIIADFRLTAKLLENAAACWFGPSLSCLSGRTAAYRTCIIKPTVYQGPCNPHANRFFEADRFGFRPEDYEKPTEIADRLQMRLHRTDVYADSLNAVAIQQLVSQRNAPEPVVAPRPDRSSLDTLDLTTMSTDTADEEQKIEHHFPRSSARGGFAQIPSTTGTPGVGTASATPVVSSHIYTSPGTDTPIPAHAQAPRQMPRVPSAISMAGLATSSSTSSNDPDHPHHHAAAAPTAPHSPVSSMRTRRGWVPATRSNSPIAARDRQDDEDGNSPKRFPTVMVHPDPADAEVDQLFPSGQTPKHFPSVETPKRFPNPLAAPDDPRGPTNTPALAPPILEFDTYKAHSDFEPPLKDSSVMLLAPSKNLKLEKSEVHPQSLPLMFYSFCIHFCNDYFIQPHAASQLHSGDDKFLTRYLICRGWLLYMQIGNDVAIETTFKPNWNFLKQYMRWTRNTWRSDFRSLFKERKVWLSTRYWFLIYLMVDKCIAPFTLIFGPILVIWICLHASIGVYATPGDEDHNYRLPLWNIIVSYMCWICIMRSVRILPHFFRRPKHLLAMPFYVMLQYLLAVLKIYCLFTLHVTDWGTRQVDDADDERQVLSSLGAEQSKAQLLVRSKIKRRTV